MAIKKKKKPVLKRKGVKKRPAKRKVISKKSVKKQKKIPALSRGTKGNLIGTVTHYFPKVRAAVIKLKAPLAVGDMIKIKGHTTDFKQKISSLQIDRVPVNSAKKGQEIGLLVNSRVRQHDIVYKV